MFRFRAPATPGQWIAHALAVVVAIFLIWWLLRLFIL